MMNGLLQSSTRETFLIFPLALPSHNARAHLAWGATGPVGQTAQNRLELVRAEKARSRTSSSKPGVYLARTAEIICLVARPWNLKSHVSAGRAAIILASIRPDVMVLVEVIIGIVRSALSARTCCAEWTAAYIVAGEF